MTRQAENSIALYRGNTPSTIEQLLRLQKQSVVNELKEHFHASNLSDLANKLALY